MSAAFSPGVATPACHGYNARSLKETVFMPGFASSRSKAAIAFILVTAVLDIVAMGIIIPVLPPLIKEFAGSNANAGWINGVFVALWAGMQFVASPIIGSLSDQYGRRPVILLSAAGLAADYVLMAVAPNLWWLALGRIIAGITSSSFTTAFAYMADITAAGGPRPRLRPDRRGLQRRLRAGAAARRRARRNLAARAVLGRRRHERRSPSSTACSSCRNRWRRKSAWRSPGSAPTRSAR